MKHKQQWFIISIIILIVNSCASNIIPNASKIISNDFELARSIANKHVNESVDLFLKEYPNAKVDTIDIKQNKFRYSVRYIGTCSYMESQLAPIGIRNVCWVDVYYFAKDGNITHYSLDRGSLYR